MRPPGPAAPPPVQVVRLGLLCGVGLALYVLEAAAPRPLPWMKLGLSNVAVLLALVLYGPLAGLAVAASKVLVGGLLSGALAGPASVIGGGATAASLVAMSLPRRWLPGMLSPVGLSLLGAVAHQVSQLVLARVYLAHGGLYALLPLFLVTGLLSGGLTGLVALGALRRLLRMGAAGAPPDRGRGGAAPRP